MSLLGRVLDITQLLKVPRLTVRRLVYVCLTALTLASPAEAARAAPQDNPGPLAQPIVKAAGTDISHWFDAQTGEVKTYIQPETELLRPYLPMVRVSCRRRALRVGTDMRGPARACRDAFCTCRLTTRWSAGT